MEATEKRCREDEPPSNCILLSVYVCRASTPENLKWQDKDEGAGNVIQE